uniref:Uncharacterized protein n=1 Tax=Anguilla anguilla TaxID=7936 RepID=A0A0E9VCK7_ANGAN
MWEEQRCISSIGELAKGRWVEFPELLVETGRTVHVGLTTLNPWGLWSCCM